MPSTSPREGSFDHAEEAEQRLSAAIWILLFAILPLIAVSCLPRRAPDEVFASGFEDPAGIAIDREGRVLVTDAGRGLVVMLDSSGRRIRELGADRLEKPIGIAIAGDGTILVSDSIDNRVHRLDRQGRHLSSFGGSGDRPGEFRGAGPLDVAPDGSIVVLDLDNHRVQVFGTDGSFRFQLGGKGNFGESPPGKLYFPGGLAIDASGRIYVADTHDFRVQVFSPQGELLSVWGKQGTWYGELDHPFGIAVDEDRGRVLVVDDQIDLDAGANRLEVFDREGLYLGWIEPPDGMPGLDHPFDVAVGPAGEILLTDRGRGEVRRLREEDWHRVERKK